RVRGVPYAGRRAIVRVGRRRLDRDGAGRAGDLAELAATAHPQPVGVPPELVPAPEPLRPGLLLLRVGDGHLGPEKVLQGGLQTDDQLLEHGDPPYASTTTAAVTKRLRAASGSSTFHPKLISRS